MPISRKLYDGSEKRVSKVSAVISSIAMNSCIHITICQREIADAFFNPDIKPAVMMAVCGKRITR